MMARCAHAYDGRPEREHIQKVMLERQREHFSLTASYQRDSFKPGGVPADDPLRDNFESLSSKR